jgi:hypothetical protein
MRGSLRPESVVSLLCRKELWMGSEAYLAGLRACHLPSVQ